MTSERQGVLQLKRLEILMDIVFALIIWRIFMILPRPSGETVEWISVLEMLKLNWDAFLIVLLSIIIIIVFWIQNNNLLGKLRRTDTVHTSISIFQLIFLLMILYSIGLSLQFGGDLVTRVLESVTALLAGIMAYVGWGYAMHKRRLLADDVSDTEARQTLKLNLAEPVTAAITIPCAFVGPIAWELSWFAYPFIKYLFNWLRQKGL